MKGTLKEMPVVAASGICIYGRLDGVWAVEGFCLAVVEQALEDTVH